MLIITLEQYQNAPISFSHDFPLQRDNVQLVKMLIVFGADVNERNSYGFSSLHEAAQSTGQNRLVMMALHYLNFNVAVMQSLSQMSVGFLQTFF